MLSGTIPAHTVGRFAFTVKAANGVGTDATQPFTLDVTAPPLRVSAPGTLKGNVGSGFAYIFGASGGSGPYEFSVGSGKLPAGLSLSAGGVISGTPTAAGTSTVTVRTTDSAIPTPATTLTPITVTVAPRTLTVTTGSLLAGTVGRLYTQPLRAAMGVAPVRWTVTKGALPAGLTLDPAGVVRGFPAQAGTSTFTVEATDATTPTPLSATARLSLTVHPAVQPAVYVVNGANSAVHSFALGATGDVTPLATLAGAATALNGTSAVTIDPDGRVYVASANSTRHRRVRLRRHGRTSRPTAMIAGRTTGLASPQALTLDATGRLYVANSTANSITVYAKGAAGNAQPVTTIAGAHTGLSQPSALTFDGAGHLWVANLAANSLTEYPAGANGDVAPLATIAGSATRLSGPQGLALDGDRQPRWWPTPTTTRH